MTDAHTNNPTASEELIADVPNEQQQQRADGRSATSDDAFDAVQRMSDTAEQLAGDSLEDADSPEELDQLLADVDSLDELPAADSADAQVVEDLPGGPAVEAPDEPAAESVPPIPPTADADADDDVDADALFDSDFDSVEAVLDGVFETKAALVQSGETTTVAVRDTTPVVENDVAAILANDDHQFDSVDSVNDDVAEPAPAPVPAETPDAVVPEAVVDNAVEDVAAREGAISELTVAEPETDVESAAVSASAEADEPDVAADELESNVEQNVDAPHVETEPQFETEPEVETVSEHVEAASQQDMGDEPAAENPFDDSHVERTPKFDYVSWLVQQINKMFGVFTLRAKSALQVVNKPLRYVPPSLRPLVDYLALTLIMWVPIVWAIAWLVQR